MLSLENILWYLKRIKMTYKKTILKLRNQIQNLSTWLWGHKILEQDINDWLKNFENKHDDKQKEEFIALSLLSQFMFFDQREVRQALKSLYKDKYISPLVKKYRKSTSSLKIQDYEKYIEESLQKTRFASIGNPSESSSIILYFFRQRNNIPKELFVHSCELIVDEKYKDLEQLIYIDDISGSGSQATNKSLTRMVNEIKSKIPSIKISYFTLFSTTAALKVLKESDLFDTVDTIFELDETYKVFSNKSRYFKNYEQHNQYFQQTCEKKYFPKFDLGAEDISRDKQDKLKTTECGFDNGQLALGFFYNIPNNTLPIFWADSVEWQSIFKRYSKKYMLLKRSINK